LTSRVSPFGSGTYATARRLRWSTEVSQIHACRIHSRQHGRMVVSGDPRSRLRLRPRPHRVSHYAAGARRLCDGLKMPIAGRIGTSVNDSAVGSSGELGTNGQSGRAAILRYVIELHRRRTALFPAHVLDDFRHRYRFYPTVYYGHLTIPEAIRDIEPYLGSCEVFIYHHPDWPPMLGEYREEFDQYLASLPSRITKISLPHPTLWPFRPFHTTDARNEVLDWQPTRHGNRGTRALVPQYLRLDRSRTSLSTVLPLG